MSDEPELSRTITAEMSRELIDALLEVVREDMHWERSGGMRTPLVVEERFAAQRTPLIVTR